ncbi:hypothetical protein CQ12_00005 [Bradyrhizobium jicamae]|uniref:Uncharacterized protein n=1 Tax=Bradyrhizobium jicamae TaxID=280332 RepID=A0A0R3LI66_9BRAD|nr:hypothetical protein [Bradyrhizobium jicamae]KRR07227.1 hypothetical protein CQ12_00005 [Bradyrhizobium jicamae]
MLKTFYFDVKWDASDLAQFKERFASDDEAIQHSRDLAARLRQRHFNNQPGLVISVLDQSGLEIHREDVYPEDKH